MDRLKSRVVVVTGASSGIGAECARSLAQEGAHVVMSARRSDRLADLHDEITFAGHGETTVVAADITRPGDREHLVNETMSRFGRIDGLVNNAGYGQPGPVEIVPIERVRQNFETNVFSLIALTQLVIPIMRTQGSGRIINIGSVAGKIARPYSSIYDATKHALEAISDGMRCELAPFGITVSLIRPGIVTTNFLSVSRDSYRETNGDYSLYPGFLSTVEREYADILYIAGSPESIAQKIVRALISKHPSARYAAPGHAHLLLALEWLLPDRLMEALIRRFGQPPGKAKSKKDEVS